MTEHEYFLKPDLDEKCYVLVSNREPITHSAENVMKVFDSKEDAQKEMRRKEDGDVVIATVERVTDKKEGDNMDTTSALKRLYSLVQEAQIGNDFKYPVTDMSVGKDGTLILTVYIKDDGELTHMYERAVAEFGSVADDISLYFDSQEREGKKHWVDITFEDIIEAEE